MHTHFGSGQSMWCYTQAPGSKLMLNCGTTWGFWSLRSSLHVVLLQATAGDTATSDMPTQMALVCSRQQAPKPGKEITISYGDKSNEHLLMAYGEHASSPTH